MIELTEEQKEAITACEKLNDKLSVKYEHEPENQPILSTNIYYYACSVDINIPHEFGFINIQLYNSENNDREFIENKNDYEPLYTYLTRTYNDLKNLINNIKL